MSNHLQKNYSFSFNCDMIKLTKNGGRDMKNRLILVEGIPGTGKTTTAIKIKEYLDGNGIHAKLYLEGDLHPADLCWQAYLTPDEFEKMIKKYPQYEKDLRKVSRIKEDYVLVPYLKLGLGKDNKELMSYLENHEVYDGRVPFHVFKSLHQKQWKRFSEELEEDAVAIFECSFLQNHINEFMSLKDVHIDEMIQYMNELIESVLNLNPKLFYLSQPDVYETISKVAKERVSKNKEYKDWIDFVIEYVEKSLYGKKHQLKGFDGVIAFFEARKKIELKVMKYLPIDTSIIENKNQDWDEVLKKIKDELEIGLKLS